MAIAARNSGAARGVRTLLRTAVLTRPRDLTTACLLYGGHQSGEALVPAIVGVTVGEASPVAWIAGPATC